MIDYGIGYLKGASRKTSDYLSVLYEKAPDFAKNDNAFGDIGSILFTFLGGLAGSYVGGKIAEITGYFDEPTGILYGFFTGFLLTMAVATLSMAANLHRGPFGAAPQLIEYPDPP